MDPCDQAASLFLIQKFMIGLKGKKLFLNYNNKNHFQRSIEVFDNVWANIRVKFQERFNLIEIYWNNKIMGTIQVKLKLKKLFKRPIHFFQGFQGEIAELKIYKREVEKADIENFYQTPQEEIFKESNQVNLVIKNVTKKLVSTIKYSEEHLIKRSRSRNRNRKSLPSSPND